MRRWDGPSRLDAGLPGRLRRGRGFGPCPGKQARPWRRRFLRWEHWDRRDADNRDRSFRCPGVEGLRRTRGERSRANYRHREFRRNRCGNQIWWRRSQCHAVPRARNGRAGLRFCKGRRLRRCRESCPRVPDSGEELAGIPFRRRVHTPWTFPCSRGLVRRLAVLLFPIFAVPCFLPIVGSSLRCSGRDERYMGSRWMKAEAIGTMVRIVPRWGAAVLRPYGYEAMAAVACRTGRGITCFRKRPEWRKSLRILLARARARSYLRALIAFSSCSSLQLGPWSRRSLAMAISSSQSCHSPMESLTSPRASMKAWLPGLSANWRTLRSSFTFRR